MRKYKLLATSATEEYVFVDIATLILCYVFHHTIAEIVASKVDGSERAKEETERFLNEAENSAYIDDLLHDRTLINMP